MPQSDIVVVCRIIHTSDFVADRAEQLQKYYKAFAKDPFKDRIDFEAAKECMGDVRARLCSKKRPCANTAWQDGAPAGPRASGQRAWLCGVG